MEPYKPSPFEGKGESLTTEAQPNQTGSQQTTLVWAAHNLTTTTTPTVTQYRWNAPKITTTTNKRTKKNRKIGNITLTVWVTWHIFWRGKFGVERKWHSDDVILQRAKFGQDTERKKKISNQTHVDDFGGFVVNLVVSLLLCWPKINRTCVLTLLTHRCHTTEFATQNPIHTFIYKRLTCKNGVRFLFLETRNGQYCHSGEFVGEGGGWRLKIWFAPCWVLRDLEHERWEENVLCGSGMVVLWFCESNSPRFMLPLLLGGANIWLIER